MCAELGGELMRRRLTMAIEKEEDESMSWKVLLDKTVEDNNIFYYTADAQGCKEFYVSVFFANDEEITKAINGTIAINATGNPWLTGLRLSGNITNLAYASGGNNNKAVVLGFEVTNGLVIPVRSFISSNTGQSSSTLIAGNSGVMLALNKSSDNNSLSYITVSEVENVSVGSYTKYFGVGSKILILGR